MIIIHKRSIAIYNKTAEIIYTVVIINVIYTKNIDNNYEYSFITSSGDGK